MNDKNVKRVQEGKCSSLITYEDGTHLLKTNYYNIKVKSSRLAPSLRSLLTTFACIDVIGEYEDKDFNKFLRVLYSANSQEDLDAIWDFLFDCEGLSEAADDLISKAFAYTEIYGPRITSLSDQERKELQDSVTPKKKEKEDKNASLDSCINKKEKLDMLADELYSTPMKDPEDFFDLARDYDDLAIDLDLLVKHGKAKENDIAELKRAIQSQSNRLKKFAKRIEEIGNSIQM